MDFSEQHLLKGVWCFTRCDFSPAGLTNSSEGFETHTAACLLSLTSPNTQGSFWGHKHLNNICSGKESLRKFTGANLLLFLFFIKWINGKSRRKSSSNSVLQAQCNQQFEAKGYMDELCYLTHSEEMYWKIRFHSLLTLLLHWHGSWKNYMCSRLCPLFWKTSSSTIKK